MDNNIIFDNMGKRLGIDRRIFSYDDYGPERRSGYERRTGSDRGYKLRKELHGNMLECTVQR